MAKYLGIDYGAKRVGVAVSDERGAVAFPREILKNDKTLAERIGAFVRDEHIGVIVIGESKDKDGNDNLIMAEARQFALTLQKALPVAVEFEPEYYSSVEARRDANGSFVDARAAAVILNRYLERSHGTLN